MDALEQFLAQARQHHEQGDRRGLSRVLKQAIPNRIDYYRECRTLGRDAEFSDLLCKALLLELDEEEEESIELAELAYVCMCEGLRQEPADLYEQLKRRVILLHYFADYFTDSIIEIFLKKYVVSLYNSLGVYLPLITTNCCVLAVTILVVDDYGADVATLGFAAAYIEALVCAVGSGVGFMLAMCLFSGVRKRVELCEAPGPFKGLPITLIAAAITSLSFMGFGGIVENLFNVTL